jgi:DNA-binding PadR family transcriptional regulator
MSGSRTVPDTFVPLGDLPFQIFLALGNGRAHGYAIGKDIEERTAGRLNPTTGRLYQALRQLREDGLIEPSDPPPDESSDDTRRRYFQLTPLGRSVTAMEVERLEGMVALARERALAPKRS